MRKNLIKYIVTLFFVANCTSVLANDKNFVSGISDDKINIDSNFTGKKILLFGAKSRAGKLIIAIRGPKKDFLVTKKDRTLGIWHNTKRIKFVDTNSYYAIFSTFDDNLISNQTLQRLGIGTSNLDYKAKTKNKISEQEMIDFKFELINNLQSKDLFATNAGKIDFLDETLFKVELDFPKNISQGVYNVDIYFINDKIVESFQTIPIYVNQVGLSAKIFNGAYESPFLYGIIAVLLALIIGWLASYLFARFIGK